MEAKANIEKTWQDLYALADIPDRNEPLTDEILCDPYSAVSILCVYTY